MISDDLSLSQVTPKDFVEIRQDAAITIQDALLLATNENLPIGKSTIQRWAKRWADLGAASVVKSVLVTNRDGASYRLDRDDFTSWLMSEKNNARLGKVLRDPERSHETLRDPPRSGEISRDPERSSETSRGFHETGSASQDEITGLRNEIMNLKIDVGIRKELINQTAAEINRLRQQTESLLIEKGALQFQLLQLAPGKSAAEPVPHNYEDVPRNSEGQGTELINSELVDNPQL